MPKPLAEPALLWIDSNEEATHHWSGKFRNLGFNPQVMPLTSGDFRFLAGSYLWAVERKKTPEDLEASFKDGRLATQHWKAEEDGIERLVILMEGNPNDVELDPNVKHAVFELQAEGTFVYWCKPGLVAESLWELHRFLSEDDHSYLRKPKKPLPSKYFYTGKELRQRVQTLMTFTGVTEKTGVEALKRFTLWEILDNPVLLREAVPTVTRTAIRQVYEHMQRDVPEEYKQGYKEPKKQMTQEEWLAEHGQEVVEVQV